MVISIFSAVLRTAFGVIFVTAGGSKLLRRRSIERMVAGYELMPDALVRAVTVALAPAEIAGGLLLLASLWLPVYPLAWLTAVTLLAAFSLAVASALARGLEIPCGCGVLLNGHVITRATLGRNLVFLALFALDRLSR